MHKFFLAVERSRDSMCALDVMLVHEVFTEHKAMMLYPINVLRNLARLQVGDAQAELPSRAGLHSRAWMTGGVAQLRQHCTAALHSRMALHKSQGSMHSCALYVWYKPYCAEESHMATS